MSVAPKRSRFSDRPEDSGVGGKVAKTESTPSWLKPSSGLDALPSSGSNNSLALMPLSGGLLPKADKPKLTKEERRALRKKKWSTDTVSITGISTNMPSDLTPEQQKIYIKQLEIEEITKRLKSNDLGIPADPTQRSPSPEPVYSSDGKRLNTREIRTKRKLEDTRHQLITHMKELNPHYMPPSDYRAPNVRVQERVLIPQDEHPGINFVGLLIGPRGNTLKKIETEHQCKVMIRGKGSVKTQSQSFISRPLPGEDEPLHALISANCQTSVEDAIRTIRQIIKDAIENPEGQNDLRKTQLMELARLNGTLREGFEPKENSWLKPENQTITNQLVCTKCGGRGHISGDCMSGHTGNEKLVNRAMDSEYEALMSELGGGKKGPLSQNRGGFSTQNYHGTASIQRLDTPQQQYQQQSSGYGTGRDFSGGARDSGAAGWSNNPSDIYNRAPAGQAATYAAPTGGSGLVTPDQYKAQKMNPNDPMQQQMMMMNMMMGMQGNMPPPPPPE